MPVTTAMLCFVVAVSAGDAMTLSCSELKEGREQTIRAVNLRAIAAPEDDQPFAVQSRLHLESMCAGGTISVTLKGTGRDGDPVADVQCRHLDAATEQVRTGLAWHDEEHGEHLHHLRSAQKEAVAAGREIWSTHKPTPPWKWKNGRSTLSQQSLHAKKIGGSSIPERSVASKPRDENARKDRHQ